MSQVGLQNIIIIRLAKNGENLFCPAHMLRPVVIAGLKQNTGAELILAFDNDIAGAINRWELEDEKLADSVFKFADPEDDIYAKIKDNFARYEDARVYFNTDEAKSNKHFQPEIKDLNDYLVSISFQVD